MKAHNEFPIILKTEEFSSLDKHKTSYSLGYGPTAIENLNLDALKQIKLTLDQYLQKERD